MTFSILAHVPRYTYNIREFVFYKFEFNVWSWDTTSKSESQPSRAMENRFFLATVWSIESKYESWVVKHIKRTRRFGLWMFFQQNYGAQYYINMHVLKFWAIVTWGGVFLWYSRKEKYAVR